MVGKRVLVTGGSRGIGRDVAVSFAEGGYQTAIAYRSNDGAASETMERMGARGNAEPVAIKANLAQADDVASLFDQLEEGWGGIDILVACHGQLVVTDTSELSLEQWHHGLDANLTSVFLCAQRAMPAMKRGGWGRIITMSSYGARTGGHPGLLTYVAAKAGLMGLTRALALELAPHRVTANCVVPSATATDMYEGLPKEMKAKIVAEFPLGRVGTTADVANAVRFLASEASGFITGITLDVNGGLRMD